MIDQASEITYDIIERCVPQLSVPTSLEARNKLSARNALILLFSVQLNAGRYGGDGLGETVSIIQNIAQEENNPKLVEELLIIVEKLINSFTKFSHEEGSVVIDRIIKNNAIQFPYDSEKPIIPGEESLPFKKVFDGFKNPLLVGAQIEMIAARLVGSEGDRIIVQSVSDLLLSFLGDDELETNGLQNYSMNPNLVAGMKDPKYLILTQVSVPGRIYTFPSDANGYEDMFDQRLLSGEGTSPQS